MGCLACMQMFSMKWSVNTLHYALTLSWWNTNRRLSRGKAEKSEQQQLWKIYEENEKEVNKYGVRKKNKNPVEEFKRKFQGSSKYKSKHKVNFMRKDENAKMEQ